MPKTLTFILIGISLLFLTMAMPFLVESISTRFSVSKKEVKVWTKIVAFFGLLGLFFASYKEATKGKEPPLKTHLKPLEGAANQATTHFNEVSSETEDARKELKATHEKIDAKTPDDVPNPTIVDILSDYRDS